MVIKFQVRTKFVLPDDGGDDDADDSAASRSPEAMKVRAGEMKRQLGGQVKSKSFLSKLFPSL